MLIVLILLIVGCLIQSIILQMFLKHSEDVLKGIKRRK